MIAGDAGKRYDRFRDRIMFPIHDSRGQVIGFGGRTLGNGEPKYLNSPETPLFSKGRELYGLFLGRTAIRDAGKAVVVEGYMDVVALAQHGIDYAVATLGTATTPNHVQKLFRITDTVVFCFDGDNAGRKAAWRALETALPVLADGKNAQFLFLPGRRRPGRLRAPAGQGGVRGAARACRAAVRVPAARARGAPPADHRRGPRRARDGGPAARRDPHRPGARRAHPAGARRADGPAGSRVARAAARGGRPARRRGPRAPSRAPNRGRRAAPRRPSRRGPSLVRELIQGLLLQPEIARMMAIPRPDDGTADGAALAALVDFCAGVRRSA